MSMANRRSATSPGPRCRRSRGPAYSMRLLAGTAFGERAPTPIFSPMVYAAIEMQPGAALELPPEHEQRGVYAVDGGFSVDGEPLPEQHLAVLAKGAVDLDRDGHAARGAC